MIELFESLIAISEYKTVTRAAGVLSISQSALSKRIHRLEDELGKKMVEQQGRYVMLTPYAQKILTQVRPLLSELRSIVNQEVEEAQGYLSIVVGQASFMTWGPTALAKVQKELPNLKLDIFSGAGQPALIDGVRSGAQMLGLIRGTGESASEMASEWLFDEDIVLIPSGLKPFRFPKNGRLEIISVDYIVEAQSIINRKLGQLAVEWGVQIETSKTYYSSASVIQMARAGFGHGVAAKSMALALGVKNKQLVEFPKPGLSTPVSLIGRKTTLARPLTQAFIRSLKKHLPKKV